MCPCQNGEGELNYVYRVCENQYTTQTSYTIILSFLSQYSVSSLPVLHSGVIFLIAKRLFGTGSQKEEMSYFCVFYLGRITHGT